MGVLATDNFNRADGAAGANWTNFAAFSTLTIVSNQIVFTTGNVLGAYYSGITWPNDQYAQINLALYTGRVFVRGTNAAGEQNFYSFQASTLTGAIVLARYDANIGYTVLGANTITVNVNDVLYLEIIGTALTAKINGSTVLTATDATYASGNAGCGCGGVGGDTIDDFEGGGFAAPTAAPISQTRSFARMRASNY